MIVDSSGGQWYWISFITVEVYGHYKSFVFPFEIIDFMFINHNSLNNSIGEMHLSWEIEFRDKFSATCIIFEMLIWDILNVYSQNWFVGQQTLLKFIEKVEKCFVWNLLYSELLQTTCSKIGKLIRF